MTTDERHNKLLALGAIEGMAEHIARMEHKLYCQVMEARHCGASWAEIGTLLGVSKQAAQQKYQRMQARVEAEQARIKAHVIPGELGEELAAHRAKIQAAIAAGEYHMN